MAEKKPVPGIFIPPGLAPKPFPQPPGAPGPGHPGPLPTHPSPFPRPTTPPAQPAGPFGPSAPGPSSPPPFSPPQPAPFGPGTQSPFGPAPQSPFGPAPQSPFGPGTQSPFGPGAPQSPPSQPPAQSPFGPAPFAQPPQASVEPPATPVTQPSTLPVSQRTGPSKPGGRVIVFSGPKEGVGKTTIALNLSLAWAGTQSRNVIVVHLDPLCRNELSFMLNVQPPTLASLTELVGKDVGVLSKLLKGRIPISQWGVGVLPLGSKRADTMGLSLSQVVSILESLSQSYDLFLDVDPYFPLQVFAFDVADAVFWSCLPQRAHFEATYAMFQELKALHFPLERFEIVVNEANLPGALAPREVESFFQQALNKRVLTYMPWEDLLPEFANTARILVVEQHNSDWVKALRPMLGKVMEIKPAAKDWRATSLDQIGGGAMIFGGGGGGEGGGGGGPGFVPAEQESSDGGRKLKPRTDVPPFWDELKSKMHKNVVAAMETERLHVSDNPQKNKETRDKVALIIDNLLQKETNLPLSRDQRTRFVQELIDEILGLGPLEELMRDATVNEIMVNAPDHIYIERKGRIVLTNLRFRDDEQIVQVIKRIVAPIGRRIDESVPLVDARLRDGSRVNAVIPPLAISGPTLTIRRFSKKPFTGEQLIRMGSAPPELLEFMANCVKIRKSIIISGGTGTGKTTFLNLLSSFIPDHERIITVEDTAELRLEQEHWVRLESRPPNVEGKGEVTIRDLVKNCLRMRPDRIVIGECRGSEALDMLQAMNTGHEGSLTTIHANTPRDALTRMEAMVMMASSELPVWAVREMITSAVHMIIQLTRFPDGTRRITYVTELTGRDGTTILTQDLFRYCQTGVDEEGKSQGFFTGGNKPPKFYHEFKLGGLEVPLSLFNKHPQADQYLTGSGKAA